MADVSNREKCAKLLQMAVSDDTMVVAIGHRMESKTLFSLGIETRRVSDLVGVASAVLGQAIGMIVEADKQHDWGYILGQLSAAMLILEEITGAHEAPEPQA
jgi:hypothetical protein